MKKQNTFIIFMMIFTTSNLIIGSDQNLEPHHSNRKFHYIPKSEDIIKMNEAIKAANRVNGKIELLKFNNKYRKPSSRTGTHIPLLTVDPEISDQQSKHTPRGLTQEDLDFIAERQSGKKKDLGTSTITDYQPSFISPQSTTEYPFSPDPKRYAKKHF